MGRAAKRKNEEEAKREQSFLASFARKKAEEANRCDESVMIDCWSLPDCWVREPSTWVYRGKSKSLEAKRLSLSRHLFCKYPVPAFIEKAFIEVSTEVSTDVRCVHWGSFSKFGHIQALHQLIKHIYLALAGGHSLYKTVFKGVLTKQEVHWFQQAPSDLSVPAAIWWAKVVALCGDKGVAYRIAKSLFVERASLSNMDKWAEFMRFFVVNNVAKKEMEELMDFFRYKLNENPEWTTNKRSLEAVRKLNTEWHWEQARLAKIGGGSWKGMEIPEWEYETGNKETYQKWTVKEIVTGNDLAAEGNRMRHCVASYKRHCIDGGVSIFTMKVVDFVGTLHNKLTIEVRRTLNGGQVIQARGLANRSMRYDEREVLKKWAMDNSLTIANFV